MKNLIAERQDLLRTINAAKERIEEIEEQIFNQVKDRVKEQGSTTVNEDGYKLVVTIPQRVSWDEAKLQEIADKIRNANDDPGQYITFKPQVSEKAYKAWPEQIRKVFEPARTVKPGKTSIKVEETNGS